MLTTTLNAIRAHGPCSDGWAKLLRHLGKTEADDEPLPFSVILESNGLDDALWACRTAPQYNRQWRLYAVWCARQVQEWMKDPRSIAALGVAEWHANGAAPDAELAAAEAAAWGAARDATRDATRDARAAARDAARDAAEDAARAAAAEAARDAARAAAEAARAAAWAAAWAAAEAARGAAGDAAGDAEWAAAWPAAWAAARAAQTKQFLAVVSAP